MQKPAPGVSLRTVFWNFKVGVCKDRGVVRYLHVLDAIEGTLCILISRHVSNVEFILSESVCKSFNMFFNPRNSKQNLLDSRHFKNKVAGLIISIISLPTWKSRPYAFCHADKRYNYRTSLTEYLFIYNFKLLDRSLHT